MNNKLFLGFALLVGMQSVDVRAMNDDTHFFYILMGVGALGLIGYGVYKCVSGKPQVALPEQGAERKGPVREPQEHKKGNIIKPQNLKSLSKSNDESAQQKMDSLNRLVDDAALFCYY